MGDPRRRPFRKNLEKLSDGKPKVKSTGHFTISSPDGKKTDPIPYDATIEEIKREAGKVGIQVEDVWGNV